MKFNSKMFENCTCGVTFVNVCDTERDKFIIRKKFLCYLVKQLDSLAIALEQSLKI